MVSRSNAENESELSKSECAGSRKYRKSGIIDERKFINLEGGFTNTRKHLFGKYVFLLDIMDCALRVLSHFYSQQSLNRGKNSSIISIVGYSISHN